MDRCDFEVLKILNFLSLSFYKVTISLIICPTSSFIALLIINENMHINGRVSPGKITALGQ